MTIPEIDKDFLRKQLPDFARQTADYHNEKIGKIAYKEFSGYFGSFAQRDGKSNMLRLRCSAGRITVAKLTFIAEMIRKYNISRIHFTTGQNSCMTSALKLPAKFCSNAWTRISSPSAAAVTIPVISSAHP